MKLLSKYGFTGTVVQHSLQTREKPPMCEVTVIVSEIVLQEPLMVFKHSNCIVKYVCVCAGSLHCCHILFHSDNLNFGLCK